MAVIMLAIHDHAGQTLPNQLIGYYKENALAQTGAQNAVTAIYLSYRVYDTIFEALTLLIGVIGIIYCSRYEGGGAAE